MPLDAKALADVTAEIVTRHVAQATAPLLKRIEQLEARPLPERGEKGERGEPGESIRGETGVGVAGALIDRSGVLVLTLSDGTQRDLGVVVGKDGQDGRDGTDGLPGADGKDGIDGITPEFMDAEFEGRVLRLSFGDGERTKAVEFHMSTPEYRGVFKEGETYERGDMVTWGGSLWHCEGETKDKPAPGSECWAIAAKKGRDGKDAK
jgi:hypothetical protein